MSALLCTSVLHSSFPVLQFSSTPVPGTKRLFLMEDRDSTSFEGSGDDDGMDSSGGDERKAPIAAAAERTAGLTEANIKKDDFVKEFLFLMENRDSTSFDGSADDNGMDSLEGDERNAPVAEETERTADLTEAKMKKDDSVEEFQPELPIMPTSSDPFEFPPYASSPLIDDHDIDPSDAINRLDDTPPVEPMRPPGLRIVVVDAAFPAVFANNHLVADVSPSSTTPAYRAFNFPIGSRGSTIGFADEGSKEEEEVPNHAESGLLIVEAHRVPDVDEEGEIIFAEAHHVIMKWYQRPFYRWILVGSTFAWLWSPIVVVIVLVTRTSSAALSNPLLSPPTSGPTFGVRRPHR